MIPVWGIGSHESFLLCVRVYICFLVHIIVLKKLNFLVTLYIIAPLVFYMLLHVLRFVGYACTYGGSTG